uniref:Uncharacterized protein n=2 Tax=Ixodes scapularis TaxID=6945 RepID=A0A1S4LYW8_IXOSC
LPQKTPTSAVNLAPTTPPSGNFGSSLRHSRKPYSLRSSRSGTLGAALKSGGTQPSVPSKNLSNRPYPSQIYARFLLHIVSAKRSRACSTPACSGGSNATSFSAQRGTGSSVDSPLRTFCGGSNTTRFPRHHHIFVSWPELTSGRHLIAYRTLPYSLWHNTLICMVGHKTSLLHYSRIALS